VCGLSIAASFYIRRRRQETGVRSQEEKEEKVKRQNAKVKRQK
jgi:hypothetical protein